MSPRSRKKVRRLFAASVLLLLTLIYAGRTGKLIGAQSFAVEALAPVTRPVRQLTKGMTNFFGTISGLGRLAEENRQLRDELARTQAKISELEQVYDENKDLRAQLAIALTKNYRLLPTTVIAQGSSSYSQSLLINTGHSEGVALNQPVVYQGIFIGSVTELFDHSARVTLLSSPDTAIPAFSARNKSDGLIKGQLGAGHLFFDQIDQASDIKVGDSVLAAVASGDSPTGLLIGFIEKISQQPNRPFKTAEVRPAIDATNLTTVFVVLGEEMTKLFFILLVVAFLVLDIGFISELGLPLAIPSLTFVFIVYLSLSGHLAEAILGSLLAGFVLDTFSGIFGLYLALFFVTSWGVSVFSQRYVNPAKPRFSTLFALAVVTGLFFYLSGLSTLIPQLGSLGLGRVIGTVVLGTAYHSVAMLATYPLLDKLFDFLSYYESTVKLPGKG